MFIQLSKIDNFEHKNEKIFKSKNLENIFRYTCIKFHYKYHFNTKVLSSYNLVILIHWMCLSNQLWILKIHKFWKILTPLIHYWLNSNVLKQITDLTFIMTKYQQQVTWKNIIYVSTITFHMSYTLLWPFANLNIVIVYLMWSMYLH